MGSLHSEQLIGPLSDGVFPVNIEAYAAHLLAVPRLSFDVTEHSPKDTAPTKLLLHIDALEPPYVAVPPVAPLVSNHDLAGDFAIDLGQKIEPFGWIAQERVDTVIDGFRVQTEVLRFLGQ